MRSPLRLMLLASLSVLLPILQSAAWAEPVRDAVVFSPAIASAHQPKRDVNGAFAGLMNAAGVGVSSGKIMLLRRNPSGQQEAVAVAVGNSRLMPLFDVNLGGASAWVRFAF